MARHRVEISHQVNMTVERLFATVADHNNLSRLFGIPVRRIKDGQGEVNGIGSVRAIGFGPFTVEETIVDFKPNTRIDYEITKNAGPLRNHHGRMDFESTGAGSRVTLVIRYEAYPWIGAIVRMFLVPVIKRGVRKLDSTGPASRW